MKSRRLNLFIFILASLAALIVLEMAARVQPAFTDWGTPARAWAHPVSTRWSQSRSPEISATYGKLPLSFEANQGQTDRQVKFLSRGSGYALFLTGNEAVLSLKTPALKSPARTNLLSKSAALGQRRADLLSRSTPFPLSSRHPHNQETTLRCSRLGPHWAGQALPLEFLHLRLSTASLC